MMNNLFSIFDPSSTLIFPSWLVFFLAVTVIPTKQWKASSPMMKSMKKMTMTFKKEVSYTLNKSEKSTELMIMMTFVFILLMNFLALYPQVFSTTSHLTVTLPLSLIYWSALMMFGWTKNTNHMLAHLVPQGTPGALMMFMVMIEMVSNIIRPITLCVRLSANLIAGHLLMCLLGNSFLNMMTTTLPLVFPIQLTLTILESAVAMIQAYVFMTLITLYTTETK